MKKIFAVLIIFIILTTSNCYAISVSSYSAVLMDSDSGRVLYQKNPDAQRLIASITKLMTAIIAIENGNLESEIIVGDEVLKMYGSNIYIEIGEKIKLIDLIYGLLMRSGNDASVVIAKNVGGTEEEFVKMMNQKANELGMKNTIFKNPHGLDEETENKSTAYDMALLSSYCYKNKIYREITKTKKYNLQTDKKSYIWYNRNKLLSQYEFATGGKTGYTPRAGKTLVTNASKNNLNLTVVTLNDGNQYQTHQSLYEYGFDNYEKYKILDKSRFKVDEAYYKDKLYIKEDFYYPLTEIEKDNIKVIINLNKLKNYQDNDEIGYVSVKLYDDEIYREKVYVKLKKEDKNLIKKIKDILGI